MKDEIINALEDEGYDVYIVDEGNDYFTIEADGGYGNQIIDIVEDIAGYDSIIEVKDVYDGGFLHVSITIEV